MRNARRFLLAVIAVLVSVLVLRGLVYESRQITAQAREPLGIDANAVAQRLARGIRHRTISHGLEGPVEAQAFRDLHAQLASDFPLTHQNLARETVSQWSLLYTWQGKQPKLPAVLLLAHQDVVPVEPGSEDAWTHPPYAGVIDGTHVWGRGALDDKGSMFCILEAVEALLTDGFIPERNVILAFGHDEELGGPRGAMEIAARLKARGVEAHFALDEGGAVTENTLAMLDAPVAVIGIAEKGSVSIELVVESLGGHSSMPPRQTAIGVLAAAITRLEANPVPGGIGGTVAIMLDHLGPELDFVPKLVLANRWLFGPLLEATFADDPTFDAMLRTTTAATMFNGGVKTNVLPSRVQAVVNFRILPGDSVQSVRDHVERTIDDERVQITVAPESREPSDVSPIDAPGFRAIHSTIGSYFPDAIVSPYLVVGGTDARYYAEITPNLYRFSPFRFTPEDRKRMHGTNERIEISTLARAVAFYRHLIETSSAN